jgi:iron complex outermembrane receptor protein
MSKLKFGAGASLAAILTAGLGVVAATDAAAQEAPAPAATTSEDVIITGSYIRGAATDAALPVDAISNKDLEKAGSPTAVQLVKSLPEAQASIGESNRFLGTTAGSANINLRGFGGQRTLVLFNNRRLTQSPAAAFIGTDINLIPQAAIGRVEILRDGAAATYGSDAVGGVVNFRTRRLSGLEIAGDYTHIDGSDGDYQGSIAWGVTGDNGNVLLTAGYRHRSELQTIDRDWATQPFANNFFGGWSSASSPGQYLTGTAGQLSTGSFSQAFLDDGCTNFGGVLASATSCRFQFTQFDNLVDNEDHYQVYGETNLHLTDDVEFHGELMWARHDAPDERVSPMQSTTQFPIPITASGGSLGGGTSPYPATGLNEQSRYYIPASNPGLQAFLANHTGDAFYANALANGVIASTTLWRPAAWGGNPLYADGADRQRRMDEAFRISGGFNGTIGNGVHFDAALTYMDEHFHSETPDRLVSRLQLALRGLGGAGCDPATGTPGVGPCQYYNPFSNGFAGNPSTGAVNPYFQPALVNDPALVDWFQDDLVADNYERLLVADFVLSGDSPLTLGGGPVSYAAGLQWRYNQSVNQRNLFGDIDATTCVDSLAVDGLPENCLAGTGPFTFYAGQSETEFDRHVYAAFAEVKLPFTDTFEVDAAVRDETNEQFGTTINPRVSAKWDLTDWLALRGSAGTTFRAPDQNLLDPGFARTLGQFTDPVSGSSLYRPIDTYGDPNLDPETARSYNAGVVLRAGGLRATVDYWQFKLKKEITTETAANIYTTMFPSSNPATWQCGDAQLLARFTFDSGVCNSSGVLGIQTYVINGPSVDTSGIDLQADYTFDDFANGVLTIGGDATYLFEYKRGAVVTREGITIAAPIDRAGKAELLSAFYSYPKWRANGYVNFNIGSSNIRYTIHYKQGVDDLAPVYGVVKTKADIEHDLVYQLNLPTDITLTAAVLNLADHDPERAISQYNYDYTNADPLGRQIKIGIKKKF